MDLVTGAISNLVPKLGELLKEEYKLQKGVRKRVECLQIELESMSIVLHKVAQLMPDQLDEQVKAWAREVRKVSYDMEDILDTFLICVERHEPATMDRFKCLLEKMAKLFNKTKARHKIATAIKDVKKQLQEVADRRGRYMVGDIIAKSTVTIVDPRLSALYNDVTKLVGINKASDDLISMLSPQRDDGAYMMDKVKKVSILGPGGLGKTTLAKAVYEELKIGFGCGAFVPVGRNPDIKKVFKDILIDLDKQHYTTCFNMMILDERQLIDELRGFLKNKRYFIVIDDIWETQSWETIKLALIENNCGSRIVITTRKFRVATEVGEVYNINPLSDDESRKLLYSRIFGIEADCLGNLPDKVSDKVLKRCGGVPLAIITMANLLMGKPIEEWPQVHNSIAFSSHKDNHHIESTMRILSFSYYDLPSHLKTCLLYLSMFPDDSVISKDPLIWKWIAEGFVRKEKGIGLFELGEQYLNELINRSMIQAVELEEQEGIVQGCRVHDMVLDLIRSLSHEENFLCILDGEETLPQSSLRRLSHQNRTVEHNPQARNMGMPQLRSFVTCYCAIGKMIPLLSFRVLRVLAIKYCEFKEGYQLEHHGNLVHLRYLGLIETNIRVFPKEIGYLRFLQTLLLNGTGIEELPSSLRLLPQLMCLRADWKTRTPNWIGMLTSLEDLRIYRGADDRSARRFVKELGSLTGLRVLCAGIAVLDENMERDLVKSLCNLRKIQYLQLEIILPGIDDTVDASPWMSKVSWEAEGFVLPRHLRCLLLGCIVFSSLPPWINPSCLPNLSQLCVHVVDMDEQDLKVIGTMPELHDLLLPTSSKVTISNIAEGGYFKKLRSCSMLSSMVQFLRNEDSSISFHMWDGEDAMPFGTKNDDEGNTEPTIMPCLEFLEFFFFVQTIEDCNGYCSSIGLEYLTALKKVTVRIGCQGASVVEVEETEAVLRRAAEVHPNHPTLELIRHFEDKMILASDQQGVEAIRC